MWTILKRTNELGSPRSDVGAFLFSGPGPNPDRRPLSPFIIHNMRKPSYSNKANLAGYVGSVHIQKLSDGVHYCTTADVCVKHNFAYFGRKGLELLWFTVQITGILGGEPDKSAEFLQKGDFLDASGALLPTMYGCRLLCDGRYSITKKKP